MIDVVVKEVWEDWMFCEFYYVFGNGLGGEFVNKWFIEYFEKVFGEEFMMEFRINNNYRVFWFDFEIEIER